MRQDKERIDPLRVDMGNPQPVQSVVSAQPTGPIGAPRPANQFEDLAAALSSLNPALTRYMSVEDQQAKKDAAIEGKAAATRALSADPTAALNLPEALPTNVPVAYKRQFMDGYREVVGQGHFARVSAALHGDYLQAKAQLNSEQDLDAWLRKRVQEENNGITDPLMLVSGQHILANTAQAIRTDFNGELEKRMVSSAQSNMLDTIGAVIPDTVQRPEDVANALHSTILPAARKLGLQSTPEVVERTLEHVRAVSLRRGGAPELFDAFDQKGPDGIAPSQTGKGLEETVQQYKREAIAQQRAGISKDNERAQAELMRSYDDMTRSGTPIDFERAVMPYIGKDNLLSAEQGLAIFRKNQDEVERQVRTANAMRLVTDPNGNGAAAFLDTKDRQAAVDKFAEGYLGNLQQLLAQPLTPDSSAQVKALTRGLINIYRNVPEDAKQLKDWVDQDTKTVAQKGAAPSPAFLLKNDLYRVLKAEAPHMLPRVFGDDAARMHEQFMRSRDDKHTPEEAFASALTMVDPAARKLAAERIKDPGFKKSVNDAIHNSFVNGWDQFKASMPELFGLNKTAAGNAQSEPYVMAWAQQEAERELQANPQMSIDQAVERVQARALQNFMWDPNTHSIIQVPPGHVGPEWEKKYHNFTAGIVKDVETRFGADVPTFLHYDGNGQFVVMTRNPDTTRTYTLDDVQKAYATKYEWNKDELGHLTEIQKQMRAGTYDPASYAKDRELIVKGNMLNAFPDDLRLQAKALEADSKRRLLSGGVAGKLNRNNEVSTLGAQFDRASSMATKPKLDNKAEVSTQFQQQGDLVGALTVMREGIALTSYDDPATGTGRNIGIGYNMDQNSKTLAEDFRRAGIDPQYIDEIRAGTRSITRDQAVRLFSVVKPRYEAIAKDALEKQAPGEWDKLQPNHKAVLVDMAYQLGGKVAGFHKAIDALVKGDLKSAEREIQVHYRVGSGDLKLDTGAHSLRSLMLAGPTSFRSIVTNSLPKTT